MTPPKLFIIGGPNGSGKTTLALRYSEFAGLPYLCADFIAEQLTPGNPSASAVKAGRLLSAQLTQALAHHESIILESTLSGSWLRKHIQTASSAGYKITIICVFLSSPDACTARITERVAKGGHNVPEADVRRRFDRSLKNFWNIYRPMAAEWMLFYNGAAGMPELVASESNGRLFVADEAALAEFLRLVEKKRL